jgi:ketosteroid isomerase-like protein
MLGLSLTLVATLFAVRCASTAAATERQLRAEYDSLERAYAAQDLSAILATRAEGFEVVDPVDVNDSLNYEKFVEAMRRWLDLNKPPIDFRITIESIEIRSPDEAAVRVLQRASRYQQKDDGLHHVEHEVRQRETWVRTVSGWKVKKIDEIDLANRKVWDDGKAIPLADQ